MSELDPLIVVVLIVFGGILGTIIGSFLNVVVWRLPRHESLSQPGSACPRCAHPIRWWDNIPIVSWLVLRGQCRDCAEPISLRYPLVELATGLFFAGVTWWGLASFSAHGVAVAFVLAGFLYLAAITVALTLIDIDTHTLPNKIVLPAYLVGIAALTASSIAAGDYEALLRAGIGMAALFLAYLAMAVAYPAGMGLGDVKLAGVIGLFLAWLGWGQLLVGAFAAFVLGGVFSIILLMTRRAGRKSGIPFGPWMLAGAWVGIFLGGIIWSGYLSLFGLN